MLLADVMDTLDSTVTNVASPVIRTGLGGSHATMQWVTAAYTLAFGVLLVVGGRLGDRWGRRRLFVIGASGFTFGSAACALAPAMTALLAARVAQGGFGALMIPQGLGVLTELFPERERGRAFGFFGPALGLAAVGGPVLAGAVIGLDGDGLGWRLIFLINVPIGAAAALGAWAWMPRDRGDPQARLDPVGAVLVVAGSALLVHPLIQGQEAGWPWWTAAELAGAVGALVALVHRQRTADLPIVAPRVLRRRRFVVGLATTAIFYTGFGGLLLVVSCFLQLVRQDTPLQAGLITAPMALGMVLSAVISARLTERLGRLLMLAGLGVEMTGALAMAGVAAVGGGSLELAATTLTVGLGLGPMLGPLIQSILADVEAIDAGSASGVLHALQQVSTALGVAVLGTVFFSFGAGATAFVMCSLIVVGLGTLCAFLVLQLPHSILTRN